MASAAPDDSGRSAEIFEHCDRDLPDSAYDLQTTAAPDPRADAQHRSADGTKPLPADAGRFPFGVKLQILKYDIVSHIA